MSIRRSRVLLAFAAAVARSAAGTGVASAGQTTAVSRHGVIPLRGHAAPRKADPSMDLQYNGGPIQQSAAIYLVFWGKQWNGDGNGVRDYVTGYFQGLGESDDQWSTVMSQYSDGNGNTPGFGGSVLHGVWVDAARNAPGSATADQIAAEARRGARHFGIGADINNQVIVLSPSGTHPDGFPDTGFCAWHSITNGIPFTNEPYVLDAGDGCGANSVQGDLDGFSITAGHEYAETITDPDPGTGWVAPDGEENGDLCAWQNLHTIDLSTGSFAVQPTWSNQDGGCAG